MREQENNHIIDLLFTLTLFGVFAASALLVVIFGARIYENTASSMNRNFTSRTAVSYITEKLRQRDVIGAADITDIEGIPAITLVKQYDSTTVYTYIYADEGYLKEVTVTGDVTPTAASGQKIMALDQFSVQEIAEGVYYVTIVDTDGNHEATYIATKCDPDLRGAAMAAPE